MLNRANHYWQINHPTHGNAFWHNAVYHTGNMAAYKVTGNKEYLAYSYAWAEQNEWKGAKSDDRENWKMSYGESDDYVLFGEWQTCFQVYADLYQLEPKDYKIARARGGNGIPDEYTKERLLVVGRCAIHGDAGQ